MKRWLCLSLHLLVASISMWADDLTITFKHSGKNAGATSTQYWSVDKHRSNTPDLQIDHMTDLAKGVSYTIRHKDKKVEFIRFEDMAQFAEETQKRMQELQKQSPQMGDMMTKLMGDPNNFSVEEQGAETVAGRKCKRYHLVLMKMDMVISNDPTLKIPMNPANFAKFTKFSNLTRFAASPAGARMAEEMAKIKGLTLKSRMVVPIVGEMIQEATEVKEGPIPASVFALPEGYALMDKGKEMLEQARKRSPKH
jgi:Domain of unknown function (DUF4412)